MLAPYRHPYNKALGIVANLDHSIMHCCASAQADALSLTFISPDEGIDTLFMKHQGQLAEENKDILRQIVLAVEFLTKQGLSFRGRQDDGLITVLTGLITVLTELITVLTGVILLPLY